MNADEHKEKILDEREVFKGRVFDIYERDIEIAPGKEVTWEVINKHGVDSVGIVAVDDESNVYLVEEYFGGTNERGLNLPLGVMGVGEDKVFSAQRELQEEIGYKAGSIQLLATLSVSPGYSAQRTHVFLGTKLTKSSLQGDEEHFFKVHKMPLKDAVKMCEEGKITEARTIAGLFLADRELND